MKSIFIHILFSLTFLSSLVCYSQNSSDLTAVFTKQLKSSSEKTISLNDASLKNGLIVVFSCNTCPFVVGNETFAGWEKDYNALYELASKNGLGLVLLNSNEAKRDNEDSFENMQKHAKEQNYKMEYLVDENAEIANSLAAKTTPHVYVFNNNKEIIYKGSIDNSWDTKKAKVEHYLINLINSIEKNKTITYSETEPRGCSIKRKK